MEHSDPLEGWVDESIERAKKAGYDPSIFIRMRRDRRTVPAMESLVESGGAIQSGLVRLKELGMLEWSVEAGILKFPGRFTRKAQECAQFRLDNIDDLVLRARW